MCIYIYIYIYICSLQCLELRIAAAFPDPQTRAFPGTEFSRKIRSPITTLAIEGIPYYRKAKPFTIGGNPLL